MRAEWLHVEAFHGVRPKHAIQIRVEQYLCECEKLVKDFAFSREGQDMMPRIEKLVNECQVKFSEMDIANYLGYRSGRYVGPAKKADHSN